MHRRLIRLLCGRPNRPCSTIPIRISTARTWRWPISRAQAGTPAYVYSSAAILENYRAYDEALGDLPHTVCYAVKANSSLGILALLAKAGAGFDIVSGGELYRVLRAGGDPRRKWSFRASARRPPKWITRSRCGIHMFNCESRAGAGADRCAGGAARREGAVRHPRESGCGCLHASIHLDRPARAQIRHRHRRSGSRLRARARSAEPGGRRGELPHRLAIDGHQPDSGSRRTACWRWSERLRAKGFAIGQIDLGGGLGVAYQAHEQAPEIRGFIAQVRAKLEGRGLRVAIEPGRSIVGRAGVLLTRVLYRKTECGEGIRGGGCGHERSDPAGALPVASRDYSAAQDRAAGDRGGRGGAGLRDRRFSGARAQDGQRRAGRLPGGRDGGGVWVRAVVELQLAAAGAGDPCRRRQVPHDPRAGNLRGPGARGEQC